MLKKQRLSSAVELAYYDSGAGPAIVFLHSFGHNKTLWFPQLTYFVERGWRVLAPDMPGHGGSTFDSENHSVDAIARLYLDWLDAIGLDRVVLVGISMGGYIALRMWARTPQVIAAMVLSNTKAEKDSDDIVARRRAQIASMQRSGLAEFIRTGAPKRLSPHTLEHRPWVLDAISMMNFTVSVQANAATLEAMVAREDDTAVLATVTAPTLVIAGSDDIFIPKGAETVLRDGIRNARLHIIQGTGHVSSLENPTEYNRVLDEFLHELQLAARA